MTGSLVLGIDLLLRCAPGVAEGETRKPVLHFTALLGTVLAGAQICGALAKESGAQSYFSDAIRVDRFSLAMSLLIVIGTAFSLLAAADALRRRGLEHGEFHALILYGAGAMVLFTQSASLILVFLSLETLSMAVYVLSGYTRDEKRSVEGAPSTSSGTFRQLSPPRDRVHLRRDETDEPHDRAAPLGRGGRSRQSLLAAGAGLVLVGLGFKIGAFPFLVAADAYEGAAA